MKKSSIANLIIIIGLLILCVMTLLAIYATAPEGSVLLFDDKFNILDENKWSQEISECKEDGQHFHYDTGHKNKEITADGILYVHSNITDTSIRRKRDTFQKCTSCAATKNSSTCKSPALLVQLQSKDVFEADPGKIQLRAKIRSEDYIIFHIGIETQTNNSKDANSRYLLNEISTSNVSEIRIMYESVSNRTILISPISDNEFHFYEINWNNGKISLSVDKEINETEIEFQDNKETETSSNSSVEMSEKPTLPISLTLGVEIRNKNVKKENIHLDTKRSVDDSNRQSIKEESLVQIDYIRLFKILK